MSEVTEGQEQRLTVEDQIARQQEISDFYASQIPFLEQQKVYQTLVVELEELDVRRARAAMAMAQIMAPPPKQAPEEGEPQPRKLKREE